MCLYACVSNVNYLNAFCVHKQVFSKKKVHIKFSDYFYVNYVLKFSNTIYLKIIFFKSYTEGIKFEVLFNEILLARCLSRPVNKSYFAVCCHLERCTVLQFRSSRLLPQEQKIFPLVLVRIQVDRFLRTRARTYVHLFKGEEEEGFVYVLLGACGNIYINSVGGYKMIDDAIST